MTTIELAMPDEAFSAIRRSPAEFANEMRLAAAIHRYNRGLFSQERAAATTALDRTDFVLALAQENVDAFAVDLESLKSTRLELRRKTRF